MLPKTRTAGDGMECITKGVENSYNQVTSSKANDNLNQGKLFELFATNSIQKERKPSQLYSKKPKFVPYEPYPAAVKPMVPEGKIRKSKNNMDINTLISQMSQMDTNLNVYKPCTKLSSVSDKSVEEFNKNKPQIIDLQKKLEEVTKENEELKGQLNQQVQVNKELKTMLVASMGEDLETQVQSLNDDKKHLANALLNSAQHLSTHQEQTEWLAGQCEVWRSKFLASSLMVEELAKWKKILSEKTTALQHVITHLLDERYRSRDMMLCTYKNLHHLHDHWLQETILSEERKTYSQSIGSLHLNASKLNTTNILDLASVNMKLSENLCSSIEKGDFRDLDDLSPLTDAEILAESVLSQPLELKRVIEEPVNALVSHALSRSGTILNPVASCMHCNGRVQLL